MLNNDFVRCLLIPLGDKQLLLPSAVIAEVFPYQEPKPVDKQPDWLLGIFDWRNQQVPLIAIEEILPAEVNLAKKYRNIIVYGLESSQVMPFYAFTATDIPRPLLIREKSLVESNSKPNKNYVFNVMYDSQTLWLPNLTNIENMLRSFPFNS
ncbi:MAG: chemotaxis protein CheW [Candidatus Marithrix sp.]|nr:chemotaxis protein CheW [Candidatus Marithrix sp.]